MKSLFLLILSIYFGFLFGSLSSADAGACSSVLADDLNLEQNQLNLGQLEKVDILMYDSWAIEYGSYYGPTRCHFKISDLQILPNSVWYTISFYEENKASQSYNLRYNILPPQTSRILTPTKITQAGDNKIFTYTMSVDDGSRILTLTSHNAPLNLHRIQMSKIENGVTYSPTMDCMLK